MKLSPTQLVAYIKLSPMVWKTAYDMQVSMATLAALVKKGRAERKGSGSLGSSYSPRTTIYYRAVCPTPRAVDASPDTCEHGFMRGNCYVEICSFSKYGERN